MNEPLVAAEEADKQNIATRVECVLVSHSIVVEAAVVAIQSPSKGSALSAFVRLKDGVSGSNELRMELAEYVRDLIGPSGVPEAIYFGSGLPRTRSGKIMRDLLTEMASTARGR